MEERQYDLIFICRPDTPEAEIDKVIATLEHAATEKGGKIEKRKSGAGSAWLIECRSCAKAFTFTWSLTFDPRRSESRNSSGG